MKFKRMLLGLGLTVVMIVSSLTMSYAIERKTITATDVNISLYGYVDYVNGVLWLKDTVYYNASITGKDAQYVVKKDKNLYVQPGSNKETLDKVYVYYGNYVSKQGKLENGSHGVLKMKCYDASATIHGYEN